MHIHPPEPMSANKNMHKCTVYTPTLGALYSPLNRWMLEQKWDMEEVELMRRHLVTLLGCLLYVSVDLIIANIFYHALEVNQHLYCGIRLCTSGTGGMAGTPFAA